MSPAGNPLKVGEPGIDFADVLHAAQGPLPILGGYQFAGLLVQSVEFLLTLTLLLLTDKLSLGLSSNGSTHIAAPPQEEVGPPSPIAER